jgi:hypothetical protein
MEVTYFLFSCREIKAARVIQLAWRKFYAGKKEEELKVKYRS